MTTSTLQPGLQLRRSAGFAAGRTLRAVGGALLAALAAAIGVDFEALVRDP